MSANGNGASPVRDAPKKPSVNQVMKGGYVAGQVPVPGVRGIYVDRFYFKDKTAVLITDEDESGVETVAEACARAGWRFVALKRVGPLSAARILLDSDPPGKVEQDRPKAVPFGSVAPAVAVTAVKGALLDFASCSFDSIEEAGAAHDLLLRLRQLAGSVDGTTAITDGRRHTDLREHEESVLHRAVALTERAHPTWRFPTGTEPIATRIDSFFLSAQSARRREMAAAA